VVGAKQAAGAKQHAAAAAANKQVEWRNMAKYIWGNKRVAPPEKILL
jgi:hypothetical protein